MSPSITPEEAAAIEKVEAKVDALIAEIKATITPCRRRSVALTHLESCWLFAREAITTPDA